MSAPVVIAAGGTGGHFFPAEALAAALIARGRRVVLMTDARSSPTSSPVFGGGEIHILAGAGIAGRSAARAAGGAAAIARGTLAARGVLARLQPASVVGFGGYPSVAPLLAARSLGRSLGRRSVLILHDQNAILGKANALLARLADHVALSFAATAGLPAGRAATLTGNPVRPAIAAAAHAPYAPPVDRISVLVVGGSLGATGFATLIPQALALLPAALRARIDMVMQCPAPVLDQARLALTACGVSATLSPFFTDVAALAVAAHLIVSRAGGSTVAEHRVIGRPAVLIPLTINADQRANARALVAGGGAVLVEQAEGPAALAHAIETLLTNPAQLSAMAAANAAAGIADAAARLADLTESLITQHMSATP
jgi:UDP-N-acetylglucosamine--N-acetylmuramyl-(pentapeptide) pyrophosphoryl-undecaprenol N-acetylglucosamine transferase